MNDAISQDRKMLTSWKEIASYLGKGVRTVQRWEAQFGLPIQRPNIHSKGIVRASREELDAWLRGDWSSRLSTGLRSSVAEHVLLSRRLREEHRRLMTELRKSLDDIERTCKQGRIQS